MLEVQTKIKRQIEILGMALNNTKAYTDADFAVELDRDIPTIKRDLRDLRYEGIDIHSSRGRGICVEGKVETRLLQSLIVQYAGLCASDGSTDRATRLFVQKRKSMSLAIMVALQRGIESSTALEIEYEKEAGDIERRTIEPLQIFSSDGYWRVLARNNGQMKQFHLNKISSVKETSQKFKKIPQEKIDAMFRDSFRSWTGTDQFKVRIRLNPVWAERLKPQQIMENQVTFDEPDGGATIEAVVNSIEELASWVISKGEGVTVLEPVKLRDRVMEVAKGVLKNYATP